LPDLALRVGQGWLLGVHLGEWGGDLAFRPDGGLTTHVLTANVHALHRITRGVVVAVTGIAHMGRDDGHLYRVACGGGSCLASPWKELPGAPEESWLTNGGLVVNTTGGGVLVSSDGTMTMSDCPL
jgi:hypothetical protein